MAVGVAPLLVLTLLVLHLVFLLLGSTDILHEHVLHVWPETAVRCDRTFKAFHQWRHCFLKVEKNLTAHNDLAIPLARK